MDYFCSLMVNIRELESKVNTLAKVELKPGFLRFIPYSELLALPNYREFGLAIANNYPYQFKVETSFDDSFVNDSNKKNKKIPVINLSREEGIRQIAQGLANYRTENTWIYVPEIKLWINDAVKRSVETCGSDQYLRTFLSHLFPQIELVHTHPDKMLESLFQKKMYSEHYLIQGAGATCDDLVSLTTQHSISNRKARIIGRVISHYGFCDYELSDEYKKIWSGGGCTSFDTRITINPDNHAVTEIERLMKDQEKRCTILRYKCLPISKAVAAFNFKFTSYAKM